MATSASTLDNNLTTGGSNSQGLADWASPYITNYLGKAQALGNTPYQTYAGPLTAGTSSLQDQAFKGIAALTVPGADGNVSSTVFDANQAKQYMNPYLQMSLDPQLEEARRQSQITQVGNDAKMTQAGAFGGARQAILNAETQRNLGTNLANITGAGYNTAFTNAQQQFNADQARNLANLNAQLAGGAVERGIKSEGIGADLAEFEKQRQFPYQQVQFQRDMISGMPISSLSNTPGSLSGIGSLLSSLGGATSVSKALGYKDVGQLLSKIGLNLGP